jgi:hypothetical protein
MTDDPSRYSRQRRLPEVGDAGQHRLERASLEARGRNGALVELAYLCRAGVNRVTLTPLEHPEPFVHAAAFRFDAPRAVGAGAWRALAQIRRVLEMEKQ